MTRKFYSYYSLLKKDAGFDCLSSLACVKKSTRCDVTIYKNNSKHGTYAQVSLVRVSYNFVPLAEILPGVFIRGGVLKNKATGEFYLPSETYATYRGAFIFHPGSYGGGGNAGTSTLHSYYSRGYETPRRGTSGDFINTVYAEIHETNDASRPASRLQFNPSTFEGSVDLRFNAQILAAAQDVFETNYPSQSVGLNDLDSALFGDILTFQGDPSKSSQTLQVGEATANEVVDLDEVLFTIPFVRSS